MERLGKLLVFTAKSARARLEQVLDEHGASMPHFIMLAALHEWPDLSQRELADRVGINGPTVTHHLDRFEQDGLITRTPDAHDRRVTRVALTTKGERRHTVLSHVADRSDAELQAFLGERDAASLRRILTRLHTRLDEECHA